MNYRYNKTRDNSDATSNYDIVGKYPVTFREFATWVLENENSFRVEFRAVNDCFGGWLGNKIETEKHMNGKWYMTKQEPANWFDEIVDKNITKCWANGGWGQITYFCTFEEQ